MIWVLTAEPDHDNSFVLGAFEDLKPAVDAFLMAASDPADIMGRYITDWSLTSWLDGKQRREVIIFRPGAMLSVGLPAERHGVPLDSTDGYACTWPVVDPLTFGW